MSINQKLPVVEKIGYAFGDAASNFVWRGALAYLGVFYTDTFGIPAAAAAFLILIVRLTDGITDIIMGMVADRYESPQGKFRPWILWSAPLLGIFMVLAFSTPDLSPDGKLIYAYITYIGLTLAYTISNVPYSALMGVMTNDQNERTSLSGFRFAGAFIGGALMTGFLPDLVLFWGEGNQQQGYQYSMFMFAVLLVLMFLVTYKTTNERVKPVVQSTQPLKKDLLDFGKQLPFIIVPLLAITLFFYYRNLPTAVFLILVSIGSYLLIKNLLKKPESELTRAQLDIVDLLSNKPWLILLLVGFLFMMFNGIKQGTIAYYFKYYTGSELLVGTYFITLLSVSVVGALCTSTLVEKFGKKNLFIWSLLIGGGLTCSIYYLNGEQVFLLFIIGSASEFFAAILPVLFFSMLGDAADYSEERTGRRATGLVYSAGTFINKTGGGFAGALILLVLAQYNYDPSSLDSIEQSLPGIQSLMSWIPGLFAFAAANVMIFYPNWENSNRSDSLVDSQEAVTNS